MQAFPALPHCVVLGAVTQLEPLQHPVGHDVGSHTHVPPEHRWPAAHAGPVPHRHCPPVQALAVAPHAMQAAPPPPHCDVDGLVTHVEPLQHPEGHEVGSHTHVPLEHR
jgi:hypothetical protein